MSREESDHFLHRAVGYLFSITHRDTFVHWERVALQLGRPGNVKARHEGPAAPSGPLAEGPAGPLHFPHQTRGDVHRAHEQAYVHGAHRLHHRVEKGHLRHRFSLTGVSQEIRGHGLVVGQALAHRNGDGLADPSAAAHAVLERDTVRFERLAWPLFFSF